MIHYSNKVLILTVCLLITFSNVNAEQPLNDIFLKVTGTWEWKERIGTEKSNPHTIKFTDNNTTAVFTREKPIKNQDGKFEDFYSYKVLSHDENTITMFLSGETRKTESGDLVIWILVLKDPDVYCWRRTDWKPTSCTKEIHRIKR